jgi:hypothetical protein
LPVDHDSHRFKGLFVIRHLYRYHDGRLVDIDTLHGAAQLVKQLDAARFVVWLNPFWGPVADDGKTFAQMKIYQDIKKRIEAVVNLPDFSDELFPQDIARC